MTRQTIVENILGREKASARTIPELLHQPEIFQACFMNPRAEIMCEKGRDTQELSYQRILRSFGNLISFHNWPHISFNLGPRR